MLTRAISGAVFILIVLGAAFYSALSFGSLLFVIVLLGTLEFFKLSEKNAPLPILGTLFNLICFILFFYGGIQELGMDLAFWLIPGIVLLMIAHIFNKKGSYVSAIGSHFMSTLYLPVSMGLFFLLAHSNGMYDPWLPIGIFILIWTSDTFAYLIGSKFGKHKLLKKISPKKTWEGYIGGIVFSVIASCVLSLFVESYSTNQWLVFGLVVGVFGTLGDLIESKMKREAGLKDSGNLMPGHGGVLDRFDSLLFASPIIYFIIKSGIVA